MSITLVQAASVTSTSIGTSLAASFPVATTPGNLVVALVSAYSGSGTPQFGAPSGFTQAFLATNTFSGADHAGAVLYYQANCPSLTTVTVGMVAYEDAAALLIAEFSGVAATSPYDASATSVFTSVKTGTVSATMTGSADLLIGGVFADMATTGGLDTYSATGWTDSGKDTGSTGYCGIGLLYQAATASGAQTFTPTFKTQPISGQLGLVGFKAAGGGSTHTLGAPARPQFETRISALAVASRDTFETRLSALTTPLRETFLERATQSVPTRAPFLVRAVLQASAHEQFVERAGLTSGTRAQFASRIAALGADARFRFLSRIASLQASTQGHFLVSTLHQMLAGLRATFPSRASQVSASQARFLSRATLTTSGRTSFATRIAALLMATQAHFLISGLRQLAAQAHTVFVERAGVGTETVVRFVTRVSALGSGARVRFATRLAALGSSVQAHFLISGLFQLAAHTHARFVERAAVGTEMVSQFANRVVIGFPTRASFPTRLAALTASTQARFATRIASLQATVQSRFLERLSALAAVAQSRFITNGTLVIHPFRVSALAIQQALASAFTAASALASRFAPSPALTVAFVRSPAVANPNSTIQVAATLTDINNNPVSTCSAVTCTVTFPDGTTSNFAMPATIVNAGAGKYTLTYTTKGPGVCLEDWVFVAADGVTTVEYHNLTPVEF